MNLGSHPLPDDLVPVGDTRRATLYPIEVLFCDDCKTAHQRFPVAKQLLFPPQYHYRAHQTMDVLNGMKQLVQAINVDSSVAGLNVLDVGCNDGSLLNVFRTFDAVTYGIEPTDAAIEAHANGHVVIKDFLDPRSARNFVAKYGHPDIITFTNVFAHIENLDDLLDSLMILKKSSTRIVIENHYLGSVLERHQFDTFYHEHPRTYSYTSFTRIARTLGMQIAAVAFPVRYGGNIRVTLKTGRGIGDKPLLDRELDFKARLEKLGSQVEDWKTSTLKRVPWPVDAAAFPGRAAIAIRLLGLNHHQIPYVYEKPGSNKIGYYAPGTRIPIVSDATYPWEASTPDTTVLNMAWHIPAEIEERWRKLGFKGRFIQSVTETDFR
jgi:hypothetical protein